MHKLQRELKNYYIFYNLKQSYKDLTTYCVKAIAYKGKDYVEELWITEEDHIGSYNYVELQLNAKYYLVYSHNNSNLLTKLKVNNIIYNEVYGKYNKLLKLEVFLKVICSHLKINGISKIIKDRIKCK